MKTIDKEILERLRELRLYHWKKALEYRSSENYENDMMKDKAYDYTRGRKAYIAKTKANEHIKFVQYLNDLFPVGDTAEGDVIND